MAKTAQKARPKQQPAKQTQAAHDRAGWWLQSYSGALVLAVLALSVWPQGLFFTYSALIVAGVVFLAGGFLAGTLNRRALWVVVPWGMQALGYGFALIHAADLGTAQEGAMIHAGLLVMAVAAWQMAGEDGWASALLGFVGYFTALLAWIVPLSTGHWVHWFPGYLFVNRWASIFQYPDTAGAIWGAGWFAMVAYRPRRRWERWLARAALMVNGTGLLLSLSRGADLVMPLGLVGFLLLAARRGSWGAALAPLVGGGVGGLLLALVWRGGLPGMAIAPVLFLALAGAMVAIWELAEVAWRRWRLPAAYIKWAGIGIALVALIGAGLLLSIRSRRPVVASPKAPYAISFAGKPGQHVAIGASAPVRAALVGHSRYDAATPLVTKAISGHGSLTVPSFPKSVQVLHITLTPVKPGTVITRLTVGSQQLLPWYVHALPRPLYQRLIQFSGRQLSIWQRGVFVHDGIQLALRRPLLGYGAGGWAAHYRAVQSLPYTSREVHNGWVQWWDDGGALAALGFAGLLAGVVWAVWKGWRLAPEQRIPLAGLVAVVAVLLGHAMVDWDLSFVWDELLIAAVWSAMMRVTFKAQATLESQPVVRGWTMGVAGLGSVVGAMMCFVLAGAQGYANAASRALAQHQTGPALAKAKTAVQDNTALGSAALLYTQLEANLSSQPKSGVAAPTVLADFRHALAILPDSAPLRLNYANYLVAARQPLAALPQYRRAMNLAPKTVTVDNTVVQGIYDVLAQELSQGTPQGVRASIKALNASVAEYRRQEAAIPAGMLPSLQLPPLTGAARVAMGVGAALSHHPARAQRDFKDVAGTSVAKIAQEWQTIFHLARHPQQISKSSGILGVVAQHLVSDHLVP